MRTIGRFPVELALLAMAACSSCAAHAQPAGEDILNHAAQCLVAKGFLPRTMSGEPTFGYLLDDKSYSGETLIYVVDYRNSSRLDGLVFTVFLTKRDGSQVFNVQNNASFALSKSGNAGISFTNPPLGGTWTSEHLASAIKQIRKQPKVVIAAKDLLTRNFSIKCEAYPTNDSFLICAASHRSIPNKMRHGRACPGHP